MKDELNLMIRLALLLVLALVACETLPASEMRDTAPVTVVSMSHTPAHSESHDCSGYEYDWMSGDYEWRMKRCTRFVPARWEVQVQQCDHRDSKRADAAGCLREWVTVDQVTYDQVVLGEAMMIGDLR